MERSVQIAFALVQVASLALSGCMIVLTMLPSIFPDRFFLSNSINPEVPLNLLRGSVRNQIGHPVRRPGVSQQWGILTQTFAAASLAPRLNMAPGQISALNAGSRSVGSMRA